MATQKEVAAYFSVEDRTIRNWSKITGFPASKGRGGYCIQSISKWLASIAMAKMGNAAPCPADTNEEEKQLEIAEKRNKVRKGEIDISNREFDLAVKRKEYAPISIITRTLEQVSVAIATNLDALLPRLKKAQPDISQDALEEIKKVIATSRNEVARIEPDKSRILGGDQGSS
ncbi:hypothetical protein N473_15690 [Pseudoalteromonas luteoviolacea CPMOR-1]|uniref:Terminase small subunit n=1 Tax=Pseudoalteromonas luteoviolacea CPMOR-1 TaxID=1365248 RepID=A0A167L7P1_9GAMM|nr:hypothetical protein [Pseudoalteromonas luteoviolacea]KZN64042.1 hypothetical protein N473_15690 [Pseudoalteromonas luteoviolacea CPMOR-1]